MAEATNPISQLLANRARTGTTGKTISSSQTVETIPADVDLLVEGILASGEAAKDANVQMLQEITKLATSNETEQARIATANRTIAGQEAKAALQTQQVVRDVFQAGGGVDLLTELSVRQGEQIQAALSQQTDVAELENMTIAEDGALGFLGSRLLLPQERRASKGANERVDQTGKMIKTIEATTTSTATTMATVAEMRTEATVDAIDEQMAAQANSERLARQVSLAETNAKVVNEGFKLTTQQVASIVSLKTEERLAQAARAASARVDYEKQTDAELARIINIQRTNTGENLVTREQVAGARALGGDELEAMKVDYRKGGKLLIADPKATMAVGNNPAEGMISMVQANSATMATDTNRNKTAQRVVQKVVADIQKAGATTGVTLEDIPQEEYNRQVNAEFLKVVEADRESITPESTFSAAPYPVLSDSEAVRSTTLHQKILAPMDLQKTDEQQILDLGVAAVVQKLISQQEFVEGVTTIFGFAVDHNNRINQYEQLHIDPQIEYPVTIETGTAPFFGLARPIEIVDLSDPTQVRNTLQKLIVFRQLRLDKPFGLEVSEIRTEEQEQAAAAEQTEETN